MLRNTPNQKWRVFAFSEIDGTPFTGGAATITAKIAGDYGALTNLTDTNPTETEDGYYLFDLTQAETDFYHIDIYPESSNPDVTVIGVPGFFNTPIPGGSGGPGVPVKNLGNLPNTEIFTLHDLAHRLSLRTSSNPTPRMTALFERAIQDAIRGLPAKHDWTYFRRQVRLTTSPQVALTVTYDHTGGAYERLLTASSGVFPEDATFGEIRIGRMTYRIASRVSDTQATLEPDFSLAADFTGDCVWERRAYILPRELTKIHYVHNITRNLPLTFLGAHDFATTTYNGSGYGPSSHFTYQNHGGYFGMSEFILMPTPVSAEVIEVSATVAPLIPRIGEVSGSGAVVVAGNRVVSVSGANFTDKLVGAVFRLGNREVQPINMENGDWEFQAFVEEVTSATTIVLSDPSPISATRGWVISSPIDAEASSMLEYIEDEAYHQYTKNHDHKSFQVARRVASESLRMAVARDNKASLNGYLRQDSLGYLSGRFYVSDANNNVGE